MSEKIYSREEIGKLLQSSCGYSGSFNITGPERKIIQQLSEDLDKAVDALEYYAAAHIERDSILTCNPPIRESHKFDCGMKAREAIDEIKTK